METFVTILANIAIIALIIRFAGKRMVSSQLSAVKKDPKKFLTKNIDESVRNKERLIQEIEKIDKIIKVDYWTWIKKSFKTPIKLKKNRIMEIEALVKRSDGQEVWYKFTMKGKKLVSMEETYKPIV